MTVLWLWSGATTDSTATVTAHLDAGTTVRLAVSASDTLTDPAWVDGSLDSDGYARFDLDSLAADTTYHYAVEVDGSLDTNRGKFRTCPTVGEAASFTIGFASCSEAGDGDTYNHPAYDAIVARDPLMFIHLGDFHYLSTDGATAAQQQQAYDDSLALARRKAFHQAMAVPYIWDDHDFGANDSDRTNPSADIVAGVYRQVAPHYDLPASIADEDDLAIYQTFQIGRVPFIVTDLRYHRDADGTTEPSTVLGAAQKTWLKAQFDAAKTAEAPLIVWCSSSVWSPCYTGTDDDTWGQHPTERDEIAQYLTDNDIPPVIILSGDAHQVSWSRGWDFGRRIPEYVSAAMSTAIAATRSGPWTFGPAPGYGHYSTLTVTDDGTSVSYQVEARAVATTGTETTLYVARDGDFAPRHPVKTWDGSSWVHRPLNTHDGTDWVQRPATLT